MSTPDPWASAPTAAPDPWESAGGGPWDAPSAPMQAYSWTPRPRNDTTVDVLKDLETPGAVGAFLLGGADTVTFGFSDEIAARYSSLMPGFLGGNSRSYAENLIRNRERLRRTEEEHGGSFLSGQVVGGFVPALGWLGRGKTVAQGIGSIGKAGVIQGATTAAKVGAVEGALYGAGSSEAEDIFDWRRVRDAAVGGVFGAGAGFILGGAIIPAGTYGLSKASQMFTRGKTPSIDFKFKVGKPVEAVGDIAEDLKANRNEFAKKKPAKAEKADPAVPAAGAPVKAAKPVKVNPLTGQADDVIEDSAVLSAREAVSAEKAGEQVRDAIFGRIAGMTPSKLIPMAKKLVKARATGELSKDPHFRAILGIDLDDATDDVLAATEAAVLLEDVTEAILEKAGMGKQTVNAMERELRKRFGGQIAETEIDAMVERAKLNKGSANIGSTVMAIAGMQFARATKEILPEVLKGTEGAREALVGKLTSAIRISAKGRFLLSDAGRNLGMTAHKRNLAFTKVTENGLEVEAPEAIAARVTEAVGKLKDDELTELLSRVKDLSDLEQVSDILTNAVNVDMVRAHIRARNTFALWLKSNTLTPMSGVINTVGFMLHDVFRNTWAREWAAHVAARAGDVDAAMSLRFQAEVARAVRWQAHGVGISAALQRIKWEALESAEKVLGVAGLKAASKASASRKAMIAGGYTPPPLREVDFEQTLGVRDAAAFNARLAEKSSEGAFGTFVAALERIGATGFQIVNETATATGRIVSGVLDDWGRAYVRVREVYAASAAQATDEAIKAGLPQKEMIEYIQKRTAELAEMPPVDILAQVEKKLVDGEDIDDLDKMLLRRDFDADAEAERVLFIDGPQTQGGRWAAQTASIVDKAAGGFILPGVLMTYIRTPVRIFERGLMSYTPWAAKADEVAKILARGGPEAAMERARMELGTMVMGIGMAAAASGIITVTNGGWNNSRNLTGAPPNRLNLPGGAFVELSRLDPFALTIAMGGAIGQAWAAAKEADEQYDREDAILTAMGTAILSVREAIFEKSFMKGASDLMKSLFGGFGQDDMDAQDSIAEGYSKVWANALTRLIPLSGVFRQTNETAAGDAIEAVSFMDRLFKVIPGMGGYLPAKVDAIGNVVEGRFMGLAAGTTADSDDLTKALADLGVNLQTLKKADPQGFDLTAEELSELRIIRAWEAENGDGQTMREALSALLADPEFQALPTRDQKQDRVTDVMRQFNQPARELFEARNQDYLATRETYRSFQAYMEEGMSRTEAGAYALEDTLGAGLPTPSRLPN